MKISTSFDAGSIEAIKLEAPDNIQLQLRADNG